MSEDDGETALKMAFEEIDKAELFPHAEAPEERDLADSRNRSRGQKARRKRLEKGWLILKRARAAMSVQVVTEPGVDSEQPGVEQPATEQTAIGQPAAEQPPVQQPIVAQPAVAQAAVDSASSNADFDSDSDLDPEMDEVHCVIDDLVDDVARGGGSRNLRYWQTYDDAMDALEVCGWSAQSDYELPPAFGYYVLPDRSGVMHTRLPYYDDVIGRLQSRGDYIAGEFDAEEYDQFCTFEAEERLGTHHHLDHIVEAYLDWREHDCWASWRATYDADHDIHAPSRAWLFDPPAFDVPTALGALWVY